MLRSIQQSVNFPCTKMCTSSQSAWWTPAVCLVAVSLFDVKRPSNTQLILCMLTQSYLQYNTNHSLTAHVVISTGLSDSDNYQFMPSDWTRISLCFILAVWRFVLQLVLLTAWGAFCENMKLSKWPFPRTHMDCSNWHILLLSTEPNKNVLLHNAKSPFHKRSKKKKNLKCLV